MQWCNGSKLDDSVNNIAIINKPVTPEIVINRKCNQNCNYDNKFRGS